MVDSPCGKSTIFVIPLGFEPKTHSLEGCCSNPTELRNHHCYFVLAIAKVTHFSETTKFLGIFFTCFSKISPNSMWFSFSLRLFLLIAISYFFMRIAFLADATALLYLAVAAFTALASLDFLAAATAS